jgi:hypothetical protein
MYIHDRLIGANSYPSAGKPFGKAFLNRKMQTLNGIWIGGKWNFLCQLPLFEGLGGGDMKMPNGPG